MRFKLCLYVLVLACFVALYLLPDLISGHRPTLEWHILIELKVPVVLTAIAIGFSISIASAALQMSLNNPLADPGIIGVSSGASLMAAGFLVFLSSFGIVPNTWLINYSMFALPILCFAGAMTSGIIIYLLASKLSHAQSSFILAGIAISTAFSAIVGWLYIVAPAQAMQSLTFWLMGSLQYTNYSILSIALPIMLVACVVLLRMAKAHNLLYLGENNAESAGVNAKSLQARSFLCVALLVGASVSIAGSIAFLGLLVPHVIRKLHGFDNQKVFLFSGILGAIVMMICANINEYLFSSAVPLSMLTASLGAPAFIYVVFKSK